MGANLDEVSCKLLEVIAQVICLRSSTKEVTEEISEYVQWLLTYYIFCEVSINLWFIQQLSSSISSWENE